MRRREFIAGLGSAAAWPLAAPAQQPAVPVIGFVEAGSADAPAGPVTAFRKGLAETGYVEGQKVTVEYHRLEGQFDRHVLTIDIAGFLQAGEKRNGEVLVCIISGLSAEDANHRHRRLLSPRRKRPRRRAPEPGDERPPPHP